MDDYIKIHTQRLKAFFVCVYVYVCIGMFVKLSGHPTREPSCG